MDHTPGMIARAPRAALPWLLAPVMLAMVGVAVAANNTVGFLAAAAVLGAFAVAAPAAAWVTAALVAAVTFKGMTTIGVLPGAVAYVDIPLAWGALAVALLRSRGAVGRAGATLRWLGVLALAMTLSWAFSGSEILRPVFYLALLGEPFAIVCALLVDPPTKRMRQVMTHTMIALALIQVPLALWQWTQLSGGNADKVQGTLWGAGAGHHVIAAVATLGAAWLIADWWRRSDARLLAPAIALLIVPVLADAKQVLFTVPAAVAVATWRMGRLKMVASTAAVLVAGVLLVQLNSAHRFALDRSQQALQGDSGKVYAAKFVWSHMNESLDRIVFGAGPAQTVSRAAFLTTDLQMGEDSSLRVLDLAPAEIAVEAHTTTANAIYVDTSFNSSMSSMVGVFGDLGIFGAVAYAGLLAAIFLQLLRRRSGAAIAATGGWVMFAILGLVFDWWEQPPFTVYLAALTGLALTGAEEPT